jgi:hypothetical protein
MAQSIRRTVIIIIIIIIITEFRSFHKQHFHGQKRKNNRRVPEEFFDAQ